MELNKRTTSLAVTALTFLSCSGEPTFKYQTEKLTSFYETKNLAMVEGDLHPYTLKNQEEGETEIEQLVQTAEIEEMWLYIEEQEGQAGLWLDIGETQTSKGVSSGIENLITVIDAIDVPSKEKKTFFITHYHTHPPLPYQQLSNQEKKEIIVSPTVQEAHSIPSSMDINSGNNLKYYLAREGKNNLFIMRPSRVITPWGRFSYAVSSLYFKECREKDSLVHYCSWGDINKELNMTIMLPASSETGHKITVRKICEDLPCALETLASVGVIINYTKRDTPPPLIFHPINSNDSNFINNLPF